MSFRTDCEDLLHSVLLALAVQGSGYKRGLWGFGYLPLAALTNCESHLGQVNSHNNLLLLLAKKCLT